MKKKQTLEVLTRVELFGDLTIHRIEDIKRKIRKSLHPSKGLHLIIDRVESIDLSFIQLLYSVRKHLQSRGLPFQSEIRLPDKLRSLLDRTGFEDFKDQKISK